RFGLENPQFYDLMFIQQAPMKALDSMTQCEWKSGDEALSKLKDCLTECMERNYIMKGDIHAVAMTIWGMVHGLVSLTIRNRFEKLVSRDQIIPMMQQSLN